MRRNTLATAGEAHTLSGRGLHVHPVDGDTHVLRQVGRHGLDMRPHARRLRHHGRVKIANAQSAFCERIAHPAQQDTAVDTAVLIIAVGKMPPDVTQASRPQHRVTHGMDQDVAIGMRLQAFLVKDPHTTDDDMPAVTETVGVITVSNTHCSNPRWPKTAAIIPPGGIKPAPDAVFTARISAMQLFDTHCHLDVTAFDPDRDQILAQARSAGVMRILVPAIERATWGALSALCATDPHLYPALGLHPVFVDRHRPGDIDALDEAVAASAPLAIGEIGLDWQIETLDRQVQQRLLEDQLAIAQAHGLPVILHVRKAHDAMLNTLKRYRLKGGFCHAFNGSPEQALRYLDMGFRLGFGGMLTYERSTRLRRLARELPLDGIVLETDAPDMTGASHQYQRNSPAYLDEVLQTLAQLRETGPETIARQTTANACRVLGLDRDT